MPRLAPSLLRRAGRISPYLATLLPVCRTVESAQLELRWIREHVNAAATSGRGVKEPHQSGTRAGIDARSPLRHGASGGNTSRRGGKRKRKRNGAGAGEVRKEEEEEEEDTIARLVARRGAGEPLQYVLGSQPFADLDILCEKGVLIPRHETEAWVSRLADIIFSSSSPPTSSYQHHPRSSSNPREEGSKSKSRSESNSREEAVDGGRGLRILDLCSGTGCISLGLYARGLEDLKMRRRRDIIGQKGSDRDRDLSGKQEQEKKKDETSRLRVFGFDIEPRAVRLAGKNFQHNFFPGQDSSSASSRFDSRYNPLLSEEMVQRGVSFRQADVFTDEWMTYLEEEDNEMRVSKGENEGNKRHRAPRIDVLVSNPPYISQRGFAIDTARSVRNYEPKIALVPLPLAPPVVTVSSTTTCAPEDIFYNRLLEIADALHPRVVVFEVGDMKQAIRVVEMALARSETPRSHQQQRQQRVATWDTVEIWRDYPDSRSLEHEEEEDVVVVNGKEIPVRGAGHGRVVFLRSAEYPG